MAFADIGVIDCDGHIIESLLELAEYGDRSVRRVAMGEKPTGTGPFPSPDGVHFHNMTRLAANDTKGRANASEHRMGSADDWRSFLDRSGLKHTVLFPSLGLSYGRIRDVEYAVSLARAYNDYVAERFAGADARQHPMALIPMQDPEAGAAELRRAVGELGLIGAMVPAAGLVMNSDLGHPWHWPVYEAAAELDCVLGVHGASNAGLGLDTFMVPGSSQTLHHPLALLIACTSMIYNGVFERYTNLRVAFLEGGSAWLMLLLDRMQRNREAFRVFHDWPIRDYLANGNLLIGCEGNDPSLPALVKRVGAGPFAYSSDYPHEVDYENAMIEIKETLESEELTTDDKTAILGDNAKRFFRLD
jgi:predicted TIM-barrel fold metal-dependent hydrolase